MEFFQQESTQQYMLHILFVWSKLNPKISYRQGMNELLAVVLYVVAQEAVQNRYRALPCAAVSNLVVFDSWLSVFLLISLVLIAITKRFATRCVAGFVSRFVAGFGLGMFLPGDPCCC